MLKERTIRLPAETWEELSALAELLGDSVVDRRDARGRPPTPLASMIRVVVERGIEAVKADRGEGAPRRAARPAKVPAPVVGGVAPPAALVALAVASSISGRRAPSAPRAVAPPREIVTAAARSREAPPVAPVVARDAEAPALPRAVNARVRPPVRERTPPTPRGVTRGVNGAPILAWSF